MPSFSDYVASRRKAVTPPASQHYIITARWRLMEVDMRFLEPRRCESVSPAATNNNTIMIIDLCIR